MRVGKRCVTRRRRRCAHLFLPFITVGCRQRRIVRHTRKKAQQRPQRRGAAAAAAAAEEEEGSGTGTK